MLSHSVHEIRTRKVELERLVRGNHFSRIRFGIVPPARDQPVVDAKLIADPSDNEVDQVVQTPRAVVPAGHCRKNDLAGLGYLEHILDVNEGEWCLTRNQYQFAPFLEMDVGSAGDQIAGDATRDRA